jgi:hypothetical protein
MLQDLRRIRHLWLWAQWRVSLCIFFPFLYLNQRSSIFPYSQSDKTAMSPTLYSPNNRSLPCIGHCLSTERPGFSPSEVHVGFVLTREVFLLVFRVFLSLLLYQCPYHHHHHHHHHHHLVLQPFVVFRLLTKVSPSSSILCCLLPVFDF